MCMCVYVYMCIHTCMYTYTHTYIHNEILLSDGKEWNLGICNNVDGTRGYYANQTKSVRERSHDFTHMWNLRNITDDHRGRKDITRKGGQP